LLVPKKESRRAATRLLAKQAARLQAGRFVSAVAVIAPVRPLNPIPRSLLQDEKFQKYQWITAHIAKDPSDPRPESFKVKAGSNRGTAAFDLTLDVTEKGDCLPFAFEYSTDLFDSATISCLIGEFKKLLENIAADPRQPIGVIPISVRHRV